MVEKLKCMVRFQYSICDMPFGILTDEINSGKYVGIPKNFRNRIFFFNLAKRHVRLYTNIRKDLNSSELTYFEEVANIRGNMKP